MDDERHSGETAPTGASMSDGVADGELVSRLRVIEDQPLEQRAEAFGQVHDELLSALEGGEHGDR